MLIPYLLNIPLNQNIDTCIDSLCNDNENSPKILKDVFRNLLNVANKESFFMFNNKFYKQIDGVVTGSPLSPVLANIFMYSFENKWLKDYPYGLKHVFFRRHMNDIFVLFSSLSHAEKFKNYLSPKHLNLNFTFEKENDGRLSFLDINNFGEKGKFVTNVHRKKTFSDFYTNFNSCIPETYKSRLIKSLLLRCFILCSD